MFKKEIKYDRETRDFAAYLDGEIIGFFRSYHDAEAELDRLVSELIAGARFIEAA